jgi:hypothetical protein
MRNDLYIVKAIAAGSMTARSPWMPAMQPKAGQADVENHLRITDTGLLMETATGF